MPDAVLLPIIAEIRIDAPIESAWTAMTSATKVPGWLGCMNYAGVVGSTFHMQPDAKKRAAGDTSGATFCDIVTLKRPHKFDFSWYVPGTPATMVEISLFSEGPAKSFVRLVHSGWDQFPPEVVKPFHDQLGRAWTSDVLPGLKRVAEGG